MRQVQYRLKDNYTRFYLKFIAPREEAIRAGLFRFTTMDRLPGWEAIMGLQFENLVFNNLTVLCPLIGLEGKLITSVAPYMRRKSVSRPGLHIDLLIQTPKALYLIENQTQKENLRRYGNRSPGKDSEATDSSWQISAKRACLRWRPRTRSRRKCFFRLPRPYRTNVRNVGMAARYGGSVPAVGGVAAASSLSAVWRRRPHCRRCGGGVPAVGGVAAASSPSHAGHARVIFCDCGTPLTTAVAVVLKAYSQKPKVLHHKP